MKEFLTNIVSFYEKLIFIGFYSSSLSKILSSSSFKDKVYKESYTALREYCKDKEKSDVMPDLRMLLASETTYVNIKKIKFKK